MNLIKAFLIIIIISLTSIALLPAQGVGQDPIPLGKDSISDAELQIFAAAMKKVQAVDQQIQLNMAVAVTEEGLELERYNEIFQSRQNPDSRIEATEEEMKKFNSALERISSLEMQAQEEMEEKIINEGLTVNRYQQIMEAVRQSESLQEKVMEYLEEE